MNDSLDGPVNRLKKGRDRVQPSLYLDRLIELHRTLDEPLRRPTVFSSSFLKSERWYRMLRSTRRAEGPPEETWCSESPTRERAKRTP